MAHIIKGFCEVENRAVKQFASAILAIATVLFPAVIQAKDNELVILTTFSREPLGALIEEFGKQYPQVEVRLIHRRTQSSIQLLNRSYIQDIDLVLTSSPFLMQELSNHGRLKVLNAATPTPDWLTSFVLPPNDKVAVLGYSGAGIVWNQDYLNANKLPIPKTFVELTDPIYFGHITMSTPSRSGTTQMMIESMLTQYGWEKGWQIILNTGANLGTISARSFGVSDYVAKGQFGVGPTIDSYALLLKQGFDHLSFTYDRDLTLMPTYMAEIKGKYPDQYAQKFIQMLQSDHVQSRLVTSSMAKHAIADSRLFSEQNPVLDLKQVMIRESIVNQIFDIAITQRLPVLKDTWLSLLTLEKKLKDVKTQERLNSLKFKLFSLPLNERDVEMLGKSIAQIKSKNDEGNNQTQVLMAEFSHKLKNQLMQTQILIEDEIKNIKAEAHL
ncbi:ABC transporter substrate-binding protein [Vibrio intestinalis]|uniref:ABC transporter substrate-binding protein n=1 Tax=Vibrio intestinalis TaxID=2933291 RepID=UPI0021A54F9C|nr:ABC transporter substrate-binding protein [Vibrio intestinalis]